MNRTLHGLLGVAGVIAAVGAGYLWGSVGQSSGHLKKISADAASGPVEAGTAAAGKGERKLLFYRNPMGLPDTSPTPKKDSMGMDYLPVYEGDEETGSGIKVSTEKIQKLGVRVEKAERRTIAPEVRAGGRVEIDERRQSTIAPKFEGYVERLLVNATGERVAKGQPLFEVYSPELVSAQREYLIAYKGATLTSLTEQRSEAKDGMRKLAQASLQRLKAWDVSDEQIAALEQGKEPQRTLSFRAPSAGVVTEKKALQGMRFMPGEALYQLADLSVVWVIADVFEQDLAQVKHGSRATVTISAYPGEKFDGRITYVSPTLKAESRTVPVRIELNNPGGKLKPGMYADVALGAIPAAAPAVTVPLSAVIDSGLRQVVLVQSGEGRFEPREVKLGRRDGERVEVSRGVKEGEPVVVAANFLLDAESNLKAALTGLTAPDGGNANSAGKISHVAEGKLDEVDAKTGNLTITHDPVKSLNWPAMTMEFVPVRADLFKDVKKGDRFRFEFIERAPGEWVVTKVLPATGNPASASAKPPSTGQHQH